MISYSEFLKKVPMQFANDPTKMILITPEQKSLLERGMHLQTGLPRDIFYGSNRSKLSGRLVC